MLSEDHKGKSNQARHKARLSSVARIVMIYIVVGAAWILLSDHLLALFVHKPERITWLQTLKGWGFVVATALILYFVLRRYIFRLENLRDKLEKRVEEKITDLSKVVEVLQNEVLARIAAEKLLRESEEYNRHLFEQTPIGLALCRMDGTLVYVNPAYAKIIGRSIEETLQLTYWDITPEKYAEQEQMHLENLNKTGRYGPYEKEYLHTDGHLVPVRLSGLIIERQGEKFIWSSVEDITHRKQAEDALQRAYGELEERVAERTAELRELNKSLESEIAERKVAEDKIKNLAKIPSENPHPIIRVGWDGKVMFANPSSDPYLAEWGMQIGATVPENIRKAMSVAVNTCGKQELELTHSGRIFLFTVVPIIDGGYCNFYGRDITEQRQADEEIRRRETQFRTLVEASPNALLLVASGGTIAMINRQTEVIFGYQREDLIGQSVEKLVPRRISGEHRRMCAEYTARPEQRLMGVGRDLFAVRKDGTEVPVEIGLSLIETPEGSFTLATLTDITLRKQAEEQVRKSEANLQLQINRMPIAYILWSPEFKVLMWNPAAETIFGYTAQETMGRHAYDLIVPKEVQPHVEPLWRRLLEGDTTAHSVNENITKHGQTIICDWSNTPIKNYTGTVVGVLSMAQDVTKRKRAEEQLHKVNRSLRALSQCNEIMVRAIHEQDFLDGVCTSIVAYGGYRLVWVGFAEEDENGAEVVRPAAHAGYEDGYLRAVEIRWDDSELGRGPGGTAIRSGKPSICQNILTDERYAPWREEAVKRGYASTMALPLIDSGTTLGAMSIYSPQPNAFGDEEIELLMELANDMAYGINTLRTRKEREKAEAASLRLNKELVRKNKELESIIFIASHDLRSALVNVQGFSRELGMTCDTVRNALTRKGIPADLREQLQKPLEEDIPETVDFITSNTAKIDALLNALLRLSRVGREEIRVVRLDMDAMIAEIARSMQFKIAQANTRIETSPLPPCVGDYLLIHQVFSNLIDNSLKFLDQSRPCRIRISAKTENGWSVYCVEDNGIGIATGYQSKVFEAFQRLTPDETPGEGLGLTIVRQIVERHNGRVWVESEAGKGSKFFVSLPNA